MFLQAAREMSSDLSQSMMVGDALTDLDAARAAGVPYVALVRTGRGAEQAALPAASRLQPFPLHDTLAGALAGILEAAGERYS